MKKLLQKRVRYVGALRTLFARTTFYISIINFAMLAGTSYVIVVKGVVDVPFWIFLLAISLVVGIAMIFEYVIMMPSEIAFNNWQVYEHNNPIRYDLEHIKKEIENIKEMIKNEKN